MTNGDLAQDPVSIHESHLSAIRDARDAFTDAELRMRMTVHEARRQGVTWQQVGDTLGTTRQAAQERFRDL